MRISVVIPVYNRERYLGEAIESVLGQTRQADEVIVVDDRSTDGSAALARSYGVTVVAQERNRGAAAARNVGTRVATGDVVAWLDSDDRWLPDHLEVVGGLLARHPDASAAFGASRQFGAHHGVIRGYVPFEEPGLVLPAAFRSWLHVTIGAIIRRSALTEVGGMDEQMLLGGDFDLWLRLSRHHLMVATEQVTSEWRWHGEQLSDAARAQLAAVYGARHRFLATLREDGDHELADRLAAELPAIWCKEARAALVEGDRVGLSATLALAEAVPDLPAGLGWKWWGLSRLPSALARRVHRILPADPPLRAWA